MGAAYAYAVGSAPPPDEWMLLGYLDRFGTEAVFGKRLDAGMMRRMVLVEKIINAYRESKSTNNLAEWVRHNRAKYELLNEAYAIWQMQKSR